MNMPQLLEILKEWEETGQHNTAILFVENEEQIDLLKSIYDVSVKQFGIWYQVTLTKKPIEKLIGFAS